MAKNNKMPAIRFSGYTDAWEQRKLSDITDVIMGQSPSSKNYTDNPNDNILVQGNDDLKDVKVIPRLWTKEITKTIDKDGIILTVRAPVGDVAKTDYKVVLGRGVAGIKGNDFIYQFLQKLQYNRHWVSLSSGSTFESINSNDIKDLIIDIPSIEEQNKISMLLNNVNSIITLHQRKLGKLKLTKTALLQKLFPQNGSKFPELRFQGFTDAWEQRKLGDLMEVTSVKRIHQADWTDSGIRFFRARDIVSSMNNEEIDNPVFISEDKYEEYSRVSGKVVEGDLLVSGVGTIGVPYLIKDTTSLYFKDGNIIWFKNNNTLNGRYFYYCFQNGHIQNQIYSASGKGTVGTYTIENGKKTSIFYPSLNEQIKIGNLLDTMTIMITLYQRKLEMLKNVKKGLLQKMFV